MSDKNNLPIEEEKKKEMVIVTGDGKSLDISPVYDHIKIDKPQKKEKKQNIVVPESKKNKSESH